MLKKLSKEANEELRGYLTQSKRPQIINLENLEFINDTIRELNKAPARKGEGAKRSISTVEFSDADVQLARDLAKKKQDYFVRTRARAARGIAKIDGITTTFEYQRLAEVGRKDIQTSIAKGESFFVTSFSSLSSLKRSIVDKLLKTKNSKIRAEIKRNIDRGHGAQGGDAVSSLQIAEAAGVAADAGINLQDVPGLEDYLVGQFETQSYIEDPKGLASLVEDIIVNYQTSVDPTTGKVSAEYVPVISYQDWFANRGLDSRTESFVKRTVTNFITENAETIVNMKGSKTFKDNVETSIVNALVGKKKHKNRKVSRRLNSKIDTSRKTTKTNKQSSRGPTVKKEAKKGSKPKAPKQKTNDSAISLLRFIGILNQRLPQTVAKNMREPGLVNRTGRFASSVQVTDIIPTPQGFPSVGYTYQRNPYQTFEPGFKQGSPDRDPRRVIDQSIREIAAQLVTVRLYTRRV